MELEAHKSPRTADWLVAPAAALFAGDGQPPVTSSGTTLPPTAPVAPLRSGLYTELAGPAGPFTGRLIARRYLVRERLDGCQWPERYRALHLGMQRELVIEIYAPAGTRAEGGEPSSTAVVAALQAVCRQSCPRLLSPNDSGVQDDGLAWLVFDRLGRWTLRDQLATRGPLSCKSAVAMALEAAEGLAAAAQAGWVLQELATEHLLLHPGGPGGWRVTVGMLGRPAVPGDSSGEQEAVWSLGALLCEALGAPRPSRPQPEQAPWWRRRRALLALPREVAIPAALRQILIKALQPHPRDRFASLAAMTRALRCLDFGSDRGGQPTVPSAPRRQTRLAAVGSRGVQKAGAESPASVVSTLEIPSTTASHRARSWVRLPVLGVGAMALLALLAIAWIAPRAGVAPPLSGSVHLGARSPGARAAAGSRALREEPCPQGAAARSWERLRTLVRNGRIGEAVGLRDQLVDQFPTCGNLRLLSGELERLRNRPAAARFAYQRAVQLDANLRRNPRLVDGLLHLAIARGASRAADRIAARALASRYLDTASAAAVTRLVNTHVEPDLVGWGLDFLRRRGLDAQVDYVHAYAALLLGDPSCSRREQVLEDIRVRGDPRFLPLLEALLGRRGWRSPLGERIVPRVATQCLRATALAARSALQHRAATALAQAE